MCRLTINFQRVDYFNVPSGFSLSVIKMFVVYMTSKNQMETLKHLSVNF